MTEKTKLALRLVGKIEKQKIDLKRLYVEHDSVLETLSDEERKEYQYGRSKIVD